MLSIAGAQAVSADNDITFTAEALTPSSIEHGQKTTSSSIATTDPILIGRTDSTLVEVVIKLDYDSVATYDGELDDLAATSPGVTGRALTGESLAEQNYDQYIETREADFAVDLAEVAPNATVVGAPLRTVYGGVRAIVPANKISELAALADVVAVHQDVLLQPTKWSPGSDFIGADAVRSQLGGDENAGRGVIFGVLDSGVWPEHPSLEDRGVLAPPPHRVDGRKRSCFFGDNPLTPEFDRFECNNKLISGQIFLDAYLSDTERARAEPFKTARDSSGHGTHTGTTAAGIVVDEASVLGVDRGPLSGVAPGAWVAAYKVCGVEGCFASDAAAAVQQAILDGVDVINFSVSGGNNPATDPVELAFLDAYAAGVFVAVSAGNDGPTASSVNHLSPWTTTVAASTQQREFQSTLTVSTTDGQTASFQGVSITDGVTDPTEIVLSTASPYNNLLCDRPAPPGSLEGKIVACQRGAISRIVKGFNVKQGGAAGMVLYNPTSSDVDTDNHWLPAVHLADGTGFVAFMKTAAAPVASFTAGAPADGISDVMAAFSSRGPAGHFIKPDITAPGVQVLAGHTPAPQSIEEGPPGEHFQAIAGTSMSSPHVAGAAILLSSINPYWTPGQIKSAMMTTSTTEVLKEDHSTPADPYDRGSGRIDLTVAMNPGITFDASADDMRELSNDPLRAVHLNIPSINVPTLAGRIETVRTATNVTTKRVTYQVHVTSPEDSTISVAQRNLSLVPGQSGDLDITISSIAPTGQYFGEIRLVSNGAAYPDLHIPVAFFTEQGEVTLSSDCDVKSIRRHRIASSCTVTATNNGNGPTVVDLYGHTDKQLKIVTSSGAPMTSGRSVAITGVELAGPTPGSPTLEDGELFGYVPLESFGIPVSPIGDEDLLNFDVPDFLYAGVTHNVIGVDSNGYLVVGGGTSADNDCCNPIIPDRSRPNNVLAPFWTDLDGTDAAGVFVGVLSGGGESWIVAEWQVKVWGTDSMRVFQAWIGVNGVEDITFAYDPNTPLTEPAGQSLVIGAESADGTTGAALPDGELPTNDLRVVSSAPLPGESVSYTVIVKGMKLGVGTLMTEMISDAVAGVTVTPSHVEVTRF